MIDVSKKRSIVIDDVIPKSCQQEIKDTLFSNNFPWFYTKDVTNNMENEYGNNSPACSHNFVINGQITSQYWGLVSIIGHIGAEKLGYKFGGIPRTRAFLQFPLNHKMLKDAVDPLHIDSPIPHLAMVYYVSDSDGCTILVNKKYDQQKGVEGGLQAKDYEIIEKVTPKQGRLLVFDGLYYHTAEQPMETNMRCIINFNVNLGQ